NRQGNCHHSGCQPDPYVFYNMRPVAVIESDSRKIQAEHSVTVSVDLILIIIRRQLLFYKKPEINSEPKEQPFCDQHPAKIRKNISHSSPCKEPHHCRHLYYSK